MSYNLELDKVVRNIKDNNVKSVCIQLPDGLKPKAKEIQETIEKETDANVIIWMGSNFGACDLPEGLKKMNIDLVVHFGHNEWRV